MDSLQSHPSNAAQASSFVAPSSLSFPGGIPPNSQEQDAAVVTKQEDKSNEQTPAVGVSGVVPTLQYAT